LGGLLGTSDGDGEEVESLFLDWVRTREDVEAVSPMVSGTRPVRCEFPRKPAEDSDLMPATISR
jgi:hypothetical protein